MCDDRVFRRCGSHFFKKDPPPATYLRSQDLSSSWPRKQCLLRFRLFLSVAICIRLGGRSRRLRSTPLVVNGRCAVRVARLPATSGIRLVTSMRALSATAAKRGAVQLAVGGRRPGVARTGLSPR